MDKLALDPNCWHYLNRDLVPIQNMELVIKINSNNNKFRMISEVPVGQGFVNLKQGENAFLAGGLPADGHK